MNIITCIKQVPASMKVEVDPKTGVLVRDGSNVKMNPYDLYALELGFQIKEMTTSTIHTITMGPPSAKSVLQESLYMGADEATLLSDRRFAGADVLATSYTLSQLIKYIAKYDLVICGKQTTDGDTAQVGPEVAEFLGIPHVPYVNEIIEIKDQSIVVRSMHSDYEEIVEVKCPCLVTVDKGKYEPRLPSYKRKTSFSDYEIETLSLKDLEDKDPNHYGLNGSPTQVDEIFPPTKRTDSVLKVGTPKELAIDVLNVLKEFKYM